MAASTIMPSLKVARTIVFSSRRFALSSPIISSTRLFSSISSFSSSSSSSSSSSISSLFRSAHNLRLFSRPTVMARALASYQLNPVRSVVRRSGGGDSSYSPLKSNSNFSDRPPTEMAPLFPGCDYQHWLIIMDKPGGEGATKQQMIDCYVQTLAKVLGSEDEAKKKIYNVSCERYFGFGCEIDEETSNKLEGLPGVLFVLPDSYVDAEFKDYGAELFVDGVIVQRPPDRQRRIDQMIQDSRNNRRSQPRPRYDRNRN